MTSSYTFDDDDTSDSNDTNMNNNMMNVDISLPVTAEAPSMSPSMPPSMPPLPPPPNQMFDMTTGQFHPDFMFCGECQDPETDHGNVNGNVNTYHDNDPNDHVNTYEDEDVLESYLNSKNNRHNNSKETILIRSKFHLSDPITSPSHILVIQSLLQPLPGVSKVMVQQTPSHNQVLVDHDAQTSTESILQALASVGHHTALWQAPQKRLPMPMNLSG
jgi:hypothetical protein